MKILITGSAGFIGSMLSLRLLDRGDEVVGIDNHNDYYDPKLKEARFRLLAKYTNYISLLKYCSCFGICRSWRRCC